MPTWNGESYLSARRSAPRVSRSHAFCRPTWSVMKGQPVRFGQRSPEAVFGARSLLAGEAHARARLLAGGEPQDLERSQFGATARDSRSEGGQGARSAQVSLAGHLSSRTKWSSGAKFPPAPPQRPDPALAWASPTLTAKPLRRLAVTPGRSICGCGTTVTRNARALREVLDEVSRSLRRVGQRPRGRGVKPAACPRLPTSDKPRLSERVCVQILSDPASSRAGSEGV
jgi:hypothetical protein